MFYPKQTFTYSDGDQMRRNIIYFQDAGINRYLQKYVMLRHRSISRNILTVLLALLISSCATVYTIDEDPDKLPLLNVGDKVKVYTTDDVKEEFVIDRIDSEYIYGESDNPKIRKDEIRILQFSSRKPGKNILYVIGFILFAFAFGG